MTLILNSYFNHIIFIYLVSRDHVIQALVLSDDKLQVAQTQDI